MGFYSVVSGSREKSITLINLSGSTASPTESKDIIDLHVGGYRGFIAFIDATEDVAGALDLKFQTKHPRLDQWFDIPGASIVQLPTTGTAVLFVGAYIPAIANSSVPAIIGNKIQAVVALTGTWTYSVDIILVS